MTLPATGVTHNILTELTLRGNVACVATAITVLSSSSPRYSVNFISGSRALSFPELLEQLNVFICPLKTVGHFYRFLVSEFGFCQQSLLNGNVIDATD